LQFESIRKKLAKKYIKFIFRMKKIEKKMGYFLENLVQYGIKGK